MSDLKAVQAGIDYIEENLCFDIKLSDVSGKAGLSQWHYQRIFKALTNETLKTYIRSRRLANSLDMLLTPELKIIDIAFASGYESQESFTRVFKLTFGLTPNEYRKIGKNSLFLKKVVLDEKYLSHINQNISLEPEIYEQKAMKIVGLKTEFYSVGSEKNNIGEKLPELWAGSMGRMSEIENTIPGKCYGVIRQINDESDLLEYFAGIEVSEISELSDGMQSIEIAAAKYAKFTHRGEIKNVDNTVNYAYSSWLLNSEYKHSMVAPDLEIYGAEFDAESEDSVMHYAMPIK